MGKISPTRFENGRPMLLGGLRRHHELAAAAQGIAAQWRELMAQDAVPGRVGTSYYGVICGSDGRSVEYMCAVEVESLPGLPEHFGRMRVPGQRYAVFRHEPSTAALQTTWQRAFDWLTHGAYESAHLPDFELYGPGTSPLDPSDGIEIWLGVVQKGTAEHGRLRI